MSAVKLYAIGNSHLDPVWLWTRAIGMNCIINTARSVLLLMREYPALTFTCSSSSFYRWCEAQDPEMFQEIKKQINAGRWEPVGGWEVQSDASITPLEVLLRQADIGQSFFESRFGKKTKIAYNVDAFGHTKMLPTILCQHDFTHYVL